MSAEIYSLLQHGRLAEAGRLLNAQAAVRADDPQWHRAYAAWAQRVGQHALAVQALARCAALAPMSAVAQLEYAQALAGTGDHTSAVEALQRATALEPRSPQAWYALGMSLYHLRRDTEALPAFVRADALAPGQPVLIRALAETEYALERYGDALVRYAQLLVLGIDDAGLHLRLSQCRRRLGRLHEALETVQAALARFAGEAPLWLELGWVQEDLGDAASAEQAYARAHALQPGWADPVGAALALARQEAPADLRATAERMSGDPALPEQQRAYLHHVLGKRADAVGDHATAAAHWTRANALRRAQDGGFEREAFAAQIDAAIATFTPELFAAWRDVSAADAADAAVPGGDSATADGVQPIFVLGMPRSGTTLAEQILAAHPQGHGCGELTGIVGIADAVPTQTALRWPQDAARLPRDWLRARAAAYLRDAAVNAAAGATRLVDKQPYNFLHVGLIAMLFADARIVWCRRDPRDIALSIYSESFAPSATYATDLDDIAFVIAQQERLMRHWQRVSPLPMLELVYEDVVADTDVQIRRLIEFVGVPWDERCLAFHASGRSVQTLSRWQVRQPVHPRSVGRWRNYAQWFGGAAQPPSEP
jgi:tetratricopeptide (TPR) repeat protein